MRGGFKKGLSTIISVVFLFVALKSMAAEVPACDVRQDKKLIPTIISANKNTMLNENPVYIFLFSTSDLF